MIVTTEYLYYNPKSNEFKISETAYNALKESIYYKVRVNKRTKVMTFHSPEIFYLIGKV